MYQAPLLKCVIPRRRVISGRGALLVLAVVFPVLSPSDIPLANELSRALKSPPQLLLASRTPQSPKTHELYSGLQYEQGAIQTRQIGNLSDFSVERGKLSEDGQRAARIVPSCAASTGGAQRPGRLQLLAAAPQAPGEYGSGQEEGRAKLLSLTSEIPDDNYFVEASTVLHAPFERAWAAATRTLQRRSPLKWSKDNFMGIDQDLGVIITKPTIYFRLLGTDLRRQYVIVIEEETPKTVRVWVKGFCYDGSKGPSIDDFGDWVPWEKPEKCSKWFLIALKRQLKNVLLRMFLEYFPLNLDLSTYK